jgi:hypothetical protein
MDPLSPRRDGDVGTVVDDEELAVSPGRLGTDSAESIEPQIIGRLVAKLDDIDPRLEEFLEPPRESFLGQFPSTDQEVKPRVDEPLAPLPHQHQRRGE